MEIRKAAINDYKEIMQLYGDFVGNPSRYVKDNDSFHEILKDKNSFIYVAVDDKIIGFISFSLRRVVRYKNPIIEVEEFFVSENARRKGVGRSLMDVVIDFAKKKKCEYVFLGTDKERKDAHNFYKTLGFDEYAFHYRRRP